MTAEPMRGLKPCPFCGETRIFFNRPDPAINFRGSINCPACGAAMPREVNSDEELIVCWNTRAEVGGDPASEAEACAQIADAYADENLRMAGDTILLDPMLNGSPATPANVARSRNMTIDGCIYSSMYHAAKNIAAAIRERWKSTTQITSE